MTMKICKKIIISAAIIISVIWLATIPLRLPVLTMIVSGNSFSNEKSNFIKNVDAFEDTVKIVQKIIDENNDTDRFCISIESHNNEISLWLISPDKGNYKLSKGEQQSIKAVEAAFKGDSYLDCIRVDDSVISFDTIDGTYSVLYVTDSADKDFEKAFYAKQDNIKIKQIQGKWYHKKSGVPSFLEILHALFGLYILE